MSSRISNLSHCKSPKGLLPRLYIIIGVGGIGKVTKPIGNIYSHLAMSKRVKWFIGDFDISDLNKHIMHSKTLGKCYMCALFYSLVKSINSDRITKTNPFNVFFQKAINQKLKDLFAPVESKKRYMSMYKSKKENTDYTNGRKMVSIYKKWNDISIVQKACAFLFKHDRLGFCRKQNALGVEANQSLMLSIIPRFRIVSIKQIMSPNLL